MLNNLKIKQEKLRSIINKFLYRMTYIKIGVLNVQRCKINIDIEIEESELGHYFKILEGMWGILF